MNANDEFQFLVQFSRENPFDVEICCDQLRALWTAYCLHHDRTVDTGAYDIEMLELWKAVAETESDTAHWSDFDSFDNFMCNFLV